MTENQDTVVFQLMDLGKKWQADSVDVIDSSDQDCGWKLKGQLRKALLDKGKKPYRDAIIISYWWD